MDDAHKGPSRRRFLAGSAAALAAAGVSYGCKRTQPAEKQPEEAADVAIVGGRVVTFDPKKPEVEAIALRSGEVFAAGSRADIEALVGAHTHIIDLAGGLAVPGLTDAHAHLASLGQSLEQVDLRGAKSVAEVVERLTANASPSGWILGRGWDQNLWPETDLFERMPTHHALSKAFPDRPVWLRRVDGHAGWANTAAMRAAAIGPDTVAPAGGELLRFVEPEQPGGDQPPRFADEAGQPTGVFVDTAMDLVPVPPPTAAEIRRHLEQAQTHVVERGITGIHTMGVSSVTDRVYREMAAAGELSLRVTAYADRDWFENSLLDTAPAEVAAKDLYALVGAKIYADGALGSRGAALLEPYTDRPGHRGKLQVEPVAFADLCSKAMKAGWQLATHAIGDRGNRVTLDAYSAAYQRYRKRNHRFRIEHAQILALEDISRFAEMTVIASMQPTHATSDMSWVPDRVGETRVAGAYAWQRLLASGVHVCFGSDFPVEQVDITHGLYAAITRQDPQGSPKAGWTPDQRVDLRQALLAFSKEAAFASKREAHLGMLRSGFQADVTCFADDLFELEPKALRKAKVKATIVAGRVVYEA